MRYLYLLLCLLTINAFAIGLEDFEPYQMYDNPRVEIEDYYEFALENGIPTAGVTNLNEMHLLDKGVKKIFSVYEETLDNHIFFHAFYLTKDSGGYYNGNPYFDIEKLDSARSMSETYPWKDNIYDLIDDAPEYGILAGNRFPMIYQRLYLKTEKGLLFLNDAEYFLEYTLIPEEIDSWKTQTLQPWSLGEEYGYWEIVNTPGHHQAKRYYLDMQGNEAAHLRIEASNPLIDPNNPFRYTVQSAFDQNPSTSFVENTEDDLMEFILYYSENFLESLKNNDLHFTGFRIINGYAQDENLYFLNNRISKMGRFFLIESLDYQQFEYGKDILGIGLGFGADEIIKGSKYNDTCLSEIDYQLSDSTWLFGGLYE